MLQQHPGLSGGAGASAFDLQVASTYVQVCRDRPNEGSTAKDKMRVDAGILLDESASIQPHGPVGVQQLAGAVYAVFHHYGRRREALWQAIYRRWLPQSEMRLRDAPPYAESSTLPGLRRVQDQSVAIYVPINGSLFELQKKGETDVPHGQDDRTAGSPDAQHHAPCLHRRTARPPAGIL